MKKLLLIAEKNTPKISFDPDSGKFEMLGKSYPESAERFYKVPLQWLKKYCEEGVPRDIEVDLNFEFISSASVISVLQLLKQIDQLRINGFSIIVRWYLQDDDEDIKVTGESLESLSGGLVFEYILV
jgi:hypothetical protein